MTSTAPWWVTTPEQDAAIEAVKVRLTAERAKSPRTVSCETHEQSVGLCTQECADLENQMSGDSGPSLHSYDPTGVHRPKPMPEEFYAVSGGRLVMQTEHPEDCMCGVPECPQEIEGDAVVEVLGDHSGEVWEFREAGWVRVG